MGRGGRVSRPAHRLPPDRGRGQKASALERRDWELRLRARVADVLERVLSGCDLLQRMCASDEVRTCRCEFAGLYAVTDAALRRVAAERAEGADPVRVGTVGVAARDAMRRLLFFGKPRAHGCLSGVPVRVPTPGPCSSPHDPVRPLRCPYSSPLVIRVPLRTRRPAHSSLRRPCPFLTRPGRPRRSGPCLPESQMPSGRPRRSPPASRFGCASWSHR